MTPYILASASPRRREICALAGLDVEVIPPAAEPLPDPSLPPSRAARLVARAKAEAVAAAYPGRVVIGADTVVCVGGRVLGKPAGEAEAAAMLRLLAGRTHTVYTGVWVCGKSGVGVGFTRGARVRFYPLTAAEINDYVATGEPLDKAGGYGIQGAGMRLVAEIRGDFYAVMGLPGGALARVLRSRERSRK